MVNPGSFKGPCKEFLMSKKAAYSAAVQNGYVADAVSTIQRCYFKRFPIDLPHNVDPTKEELAAINDESPDVEPEAPDRENMTEQELTEAVRKKKERSILVDFQKAQIKQWLAYQYMKDHDVTAKEKGPYSPYTILMQKLTGRVTSQPRLRSAANLWRKDQCDLIEDHLKSDIELANRQGKPIPKSNYTAARNKIAWWKDQADLEHKEGEKAYLAEIAAPPAKDPESRQRAIQGLTQFMQLILDLVGEVTGWKVSMIAGGPESAHDGRLNTISVHSGYTTGDIKMTFGRCKRAHYKSDFIPMFGSFLKKCYSPEQCRSHAIPIGQGFMPMSKLENTPNDHVSFHTIPDQQLLPTQQQPKQLSDSLPSQSISSAPAEEVNGTGAEVSVPESSINLFPCAPYQISPRNTPSPTVSRAPSPAISRAHSPAVSCASSPAMSRVSSPAISCAPSPQPYSPPTSPPILNLSSEVAPHPIENVIPMAIATGRNMSVGVEPQPDVSQPEVKSAKIKKHTEIALPIVETGSKRTRTKSARALDAEASLLTKKGTRKWKASGGTAATADDILMQEVDDASADGKAKDKNSRKQVADTAASLDTGVIVEPPAKHKRVARASEPKAKHC